jgi:hypothetical protein
MFIAGVHVYLYRNPYCDIVRICRNVTEEVDSDRSATDIVREVSGSNQGQEADYLNMYFMAHQLATNQIAVTFHW